MIPELNQYVDFITQRVDYSPIDNILSKFIFIFNIFFRFKFGQKHQIVQLGVNKMAKKTPFLFIFSFLHFLFIKEECKQNKNNGYYRL